MDRSMFAISLCSDGVIHSYEICDDGAVLKVATCGSRAEQVGPGDDDSLVCDECLQWIAQWCCPEDPDGFIESAERERRSDR